MLKFAFLIGFSRLKSRSTVQSTGMRKCLPLQSREGHRVSQSGTTHTSLLCDIASRQLNSGNHHVLSYGCHAGLVREWSGFLVLVRGTDMPIKSQLLWRQYDFWSRNSSSQPREHSEWEFISRKKGKKREEKERGSRLGIKCICLAVGACLVTYTYALFPSVSVFRESQDLFIRGSSLWADLRFSTLANNCHGAWPVWMPSKYSDLAWEVTYCQFSVTPKLFQWEECQSHIVRRVRLLQKRLKQLWKYALLLWSMKHSVQLCPSLAHLEYVVGDRLAIDYRQVCKMCVSKQVEKNLVQ